MTVEDVSGPSGPLVLLAHGSPDPRHREGIERLARTVGALAPGLQIHVAYLDHHGPTPAKAAAAASVGVVAAPVPVIPVLLTPAFHSRVDVPAAIAAMNDHVTPTFVATSALGPHPLLLVAALELLGGPQQERAGRHTVLFAAGSSDGTAARSIATTLRDQPPTDGSTWHVAALGGGTALEDVLSGLSPATTDIVPFMVADGVLVDRMRLRTGAVGHRLVPGTFSATVALARLVLVRILDASSTTDTIHRP
ncbi:MULTISPECIES: sirohydrochlorin chelatase [unclassified Janibacter]|uniref:sirohydrochlorin chelatase n=1 Tax=unclassified Janibacter TaxID=2649294 RepID=UPI003D054CD6